MRSKTLSESGVPLAAKGGPFRTFGTLVTFMVTVLLGTGGYLIGEQFAHPVEAQAVALLFAALLIATGIMLIYALLRTAAKLRSQAKTKKHTAQAPTGELEAHEPCPQEANYARGVNPRYIDRARVRAVKRNSGPGYGREVAFFEDKTVM